MADRSEDRPRRGLDADGFDYFCGVCGLGIMYGCGKDGWRAWGDGSGDCDLLRGVVYCGRGEYVDGCDQGGVFVPGGTADFSGGFLVAGDRRRCRDVEVSLNREGRDGDESAGGVQRRGDRGHHHDHGAGIEGAAGDHFRCVETIVHDIGQLRLEFLVRGDLLEQPPPYAAYVQKGDRRNSLGEPAFVVLAVTDTVCDRVDGGKVLG